MRGVAIVFDAEHAAMRATLKTVDVPGKIAKRAKMSSCRITGSAGRWCLVRPGFFEGIGSILGSRGRVQLQAMAISSR
jgi:hypothetical protein